MGLAFCSCFEVVFFLAARAPLTLVSDYAAGDSGAVLLVLISISRPSILSQSQTHAVAPLARASLAAPSALFLYKGSKLGAPRNVEPHGWDHEAPFLLYHAQCGGGTGG